MSKDGGPAFPAAIQRDAEEDFKDLGGATGAYILLNPGMSLRDWFAGMALQGYITARTVIGDQQLTNICYAKADAMLEAREK